MSKKKAQKKGKKRTSISSAQQAPASAAPSSSRLSRLWGFLQELSRDRRVYWICAILLPLAVLAYYPSYRALYSDFDLWFHLTYGEHFVQNLTATIDHSKFSWTSASNPDSYVTWLGSSALYLVHSAWGVPGLFGLHYAVLLATGAVVFWLARSANLRTSLALLCAVLLAAISMRIAANFIKPEMFSILLMALTVACYLRFRLEPGRWIMVVLPIFFLIWVNTHGLWQFGFTFLGIVFAVDLVLYFLLPGQALQRKALLYLGAAVALSFVALCVNPYGPAIPLGFVQGRISQLFSIFFATGGDGGQVLQHYRAIAEYQSMWPHLFYGEEEHFMTVSALGMSAMILIFLVFWAVSWKRSGLAELPIAAANIFFFFMAMFMARLALVFCLVWLLSMVFLAWRAGPEPAFPRLRPVILAAFLLLVMYSGFAAASLYHHPSWFGQGYREYIPDKEVQYLLASDLPGPIFNDYLSGGYMMWSMYPQYKVFIDPRHFPYGEQVFPDYMSIGQKYPHNAQGLKEFTQKYPAQVALIHRRYPEQIQWFANAPGWTMVYFDKVAVVMIQRDLIPELSREAREEAMRGPGNYEDVSNPIVLEYLFNIYLNFVSTDFAKETRDIFEENVSDLYWQKDSTLEKFDQGLQKKKAEESEEEYQ